MQYTAEDLAFALVDSGEQDYVRIAADWLTRGDPQSAEPSLTGNQVVDALVASAVAHKASAEGQQVPAWTHAQDRALASLWHPGGVAFFAYSLAHSPAEFLIRGIVVEADSLVSV